MRGAFFGILGARALHRLVFLTELVVQLERTPRAMVKPSSAVLRGLLCHDIGVDAEIGELARGEEFAALA